MFHIKNKAFTLVELIVVVTILAILATIGFVSYSSYLIWVRDTNRQTQLVSIHDWLELYRTKNDLPLPDDNVAINIWSNTIWYQWYAGSNTLQTIEFTQGWKDPRDNLYFTYFLSSDRKYFQLLTFLEEDESLSVNLVNDSYALDYSTRVPSVYGDKLGILTDSSNKPIQEVVSEEIDISTTADDYTLHLTDGEYLTASWSNLSVLKNIIEVWGRGYSIIGETVSYNNPDKSIPRDWLLLELLFNGGSKDNIWKNTDGIENGTIDYVDGIDMIWNRRGEAIYFNWMAGSYLSIPHSTSIEWMENSFAWSFWFKTAWDQPNQYARFLEFSDTASSLWFSTNHALRNWINAGGTRSAELQKTGLNDQEWHHVVFQRDWSIISLYVDWIYNSSSSKSSTLLDYTTADLTISKSNYPFFGAIDNVRVYDDILTESEIEQLFEERKF